MTVGSSSAARLPSGLMAQILLAILAGAAGVLAFAPFNFWPFALLSLWLLFSFWDRGTTAARAFALGFAWGLGLFVAGVSWIFVSLHTYGGMPPILAGFATFLFCCYLALYPALAGAVHRALASRLNLSPQVELLLLMPACFVAFEYLRGWVVSGFPWLSMGYSQTPGGAISAPLAGYAAIIGVYGISWLLAGIVCLIMLLAKSTSLKAPWRSANAVLAVFPLLIASAGYVLYQIAWSEPSGKPVTVALMQGNIEQNLKWRDDQRAPTLANYHQQVIGSVAKLIVLPETALPDLLDRIPPDFIDSIRLHAQHNGADVLMGAPIAERGGTNGSQLHLTNSAVSIGVSPSQRYDKQHLVAFGEFVPPMFAWVYRWLQIPMSDFNPRAEDPRPMLIAGHRIAINICYEDTFGREIAAQLPAAELLVNISNMAWFGASLAADQHAQMSQMRALETSRWMLRATNTGVTAAINEKGMIVKSLPPFTRGVLELEAQPLSGATPYSIWRDIPLLVLLAASIVFAIALGRRQSVPRR